MINRTIVRSLTCVVVAIMASRLLATDAYIQSSGVQAINTGYFANPETRIVADFQFTDTSGQARVFGADNTTDHANGGIGLVSCSLYVNGANTKFAYAMRDGVGQWTTMADRDTARHTYILDSNKVYFITGGTTNYTGSLTRSSITRTSDWPLAIFANCRSTDFSHLEAGQYGKLKLYALRIYDGATPVHYFLPYARDGVTGLKDAITGCVYPDYRGAAFDYGGDIGVYEGYDAADCPSEYLHSDYEVVDGKLVDMSSGRFRENNGTLEYRARVVGRCCTVSISGGDPRYFADMWIPWGSSQTVALSAQAGCGHSFMEWRSDEVAIPQETKANASIMLTILKPCDVVAFGRSLSDPYSDARLWMRSMGIDANGNGIVEDGELGDSLGQTDVGRLARAYNSPVFRNEAVRMPRAGVRKVLQSVYLPQKVTWTNEACTLGTVSVNAIHLAEGADFEKYGLATNSFTVAVRFRPDDEQLRTDGLNWMSLGYSEDEQRGFQLGLTNRKVATNTYQTASSGAFKKEYAKYTLRFNRKGGYAAQMVDAVWTGCWHDLIVSVEGSTVRWMLVRAGSFDEGEMPVDVTAKSVSDSAGRCTVYQEFSMGSSNDKENSAIPSSSQPWILGLGVNVNSRTDMSWDGTKANGGRGDSWGDLHTKCYRGSFHQVVLWNRSMDFEEMGAAIAWPRQDVARIGVENGTASEFAGGALAEQDEWCWNFPKGFAAGDSATFKFVLEDGLAGVGQRVRWVSAPGSDGGTVRLVINGVDCKTKPVGPAAATTWFVAGDCMVAGTNVATFVRADGGEGLVVPDIVEVGGSWQVGRQDGTFYDLGLETSATNVNSVANGNFFDYPRAYFGSLESTSQYTNAVFRFSIPADLLQPGTSRFKLCWRTVKSASSSHSDHLVCWRLNGSDVYSATSDDEIHVINLNNSLLEGDNALEVYNGGAFASGKYFGLDFVRLECKSRDGFTIVFR